MIRKVFKSCGSLCVAAVLPKPEITTQTEVNDGWQRVKNIFSVDEFGVITPQLNNMIQTGLFTSFIGAIYGGFIEGKEAYLTFIERNDATKFVDHFEAKKKLQDRIFLAFGKGGFKWGWRIGAFATTYVTCVTVLSEYRNESRLIDYVAGGMVAGTVYRVNYGVRGMIVGCTLGAMVGLFAGSLTTSLLRLTGTSLDDVYQYRAEAVAQRDRLKAEAVSKVISQDVDETILHLHDELVKGK